MGIVDRGHLVKSPDGRYVSWEAETLPSNLIPEAVKRKLTPYNSLVCAVSRSALESEVIPTKIIFNGPATICFFADGTKEVVKKMEFETDDREKAVLYCIIKHILHFKEPMYKEYGYFKKKLEEKIEEGTINKFIVPEPDKKEEPHYCGNCRHFSKKITDDPCAVCCVKGKHVNWEAHRRKK